MLNKRLLSHGGNHVPILNDVVAVNLKKLKLEILINLSSPV